MNAIAKGTEFPTFFIQIEPVDGTGRRRKPFLQRFVGHLRIGAAHECWECDLAHDTGSLGYCRIRRDGTTPYVHRIAYEISHGPIPPGMNVLHRCDNPRCCNPNHLRVGNHNDNVADMAAKGRRGKRLTFANVREIDKMLRADASHAKIARKFGVSELTVRNIEWGVTWSRITGRQTPRQRVEAKRHGKRPAPGTITAEGTAA